MLAQRGKIDAALLVRTPDSDQIKRLLSSGWRMAELNDKDINDLIWGKKSLYEKVTLQVTDSDGKRRKNDTYKIPSFVVGSESLADNPELFDTLIGALN